MKTLFIAIGMLMALMFTTSVSYAECSEELTRSDINRIADDHTIGNTIYATVVPDLATQAKATSDKCYDEGWTNGFLIGGGIVLGAAIVVGSAVYFLAPDAEANFGLTGGIISVSPNQTLFYRPMLEAVGERGGLIGANFGLSW